jgi:hypothetical protein
LSYPISITFSRVIVQNISDRMRSAEEGIWDHIAPDRVGQANNTENNPEKVGKWLYCVDPEENHRKAKSCREPETGKWFLEGDQYADWKRSAIQFLWLHGIRKSIMDGRFWEEQY